ncbi:dual specificity tyrosine-phosphorylation-regulated kinase 2-like, partial [Trichoplusia ni]|uniref:Dual specificity tyrosine-phosphorylation-regulated kinase 2-like n=1 Tax=Trichoplusia ni TaxID=7111 RepID=A0A7E5W0T5_TRINI
FSYKKIINKTSLVFQVIDFGSSCYEHQRVYTYIQSRFYRAPEVMMGARYGMPIDMWSLGCILAELLTGFPLLPGEDEADQMACIIELLGMPPQKLIEQGKRAKNFISSKGLPRYCTATTLADGTTVLSGGMSRRGKPRGPPGSKSFVTALKGCQDKFFIDFIRRCLEWDPEKRLTPAAALRHAWLRRGCRGRRTTRSPRPRRCRTRCRTRCPPTTLSIAHHAKRQAHPKCTDK